MRQLERIQRIATKVRAALEAVAPKINKRVKGDEESLACFCAIASHALHTAFKKKRIKSQLIVGYFDEDAIWDDLGDEEIDALDPNHCWVETPYGIVDITATQFKDSEYVNKKVVIVDNNNPQKTGFYPLEFPQSDNSIHLSKSKWGQQAPDKKYTKQILALAQI